MSANASGIMQNMYEIMKKEILDGHANTREYFHAKEIFLNSLSWIESYHRKYENGRSTESNRSDRDREKTYEGSRDE